jgi:hypothetical protein
MLCYNKFLILRFVCEQEGVLGFQGKRVFSCFWLGVFTHNDNGDNKKERKTCGGVYDLDNLMLFSCIWDEYAIVDIVGCWLIVWQGSYQVKNGQWKSCCGVEK